jgi:hypothetical protein
MRRTALLAPLWAGIAALGQASSEQPVNHPVISELRYRQHSGVNEEFVELHNPTARSIGLEGWSIAYKKKTGGTWDVKVVFRRGQVLRPHGYFLWGGDSTAVPPDTAATRASAVGLGNSGGNLALRDSTGVDVDRVAWEGGDAAEGRPVAGKNVEGGSLERKANAASTAASMSPGGEDASAGNGCDTDDNASDFVLHNHFAETNPQNSACAAEPEGGVPAGAGTCDVTPLRVPVCEPASLRFTFRPDSAAVATGLMLAVSGAVEWSFLESDVRVEGKESVYARTTISGDTVRIGGLFLLYPDSVAVILRSIGMPAQPGSVEFPAWIELAGDRPRSAARTPVVEVHPAVIPLIRLHANDGLGVPAPPFSVGSRVMVSGVVTAGCGVFTSNRIFLQDSTAGLAIDADGFPGDLAAGDSITVSGALTQVHGLTELRPDRNTLSVRGSRGGVPRPADVTCAEINASFRDDGNEPDESRLIRIRRVDYDPETGTVSDVTGAVRVMIEEGTGLAIPDGLFDAVGLLVQDKRGAEEPPYTSDYGILPRGQSDLMPLEEPQSAPAPESGGNGLALFANRPNPFNGETEVQFRIPSAGRVRLSIVDVRGREVAVLLNRGGEAGVRAVRWNGRSDTGESLPSGVYVCRLVSGAGIRCGKMLLVR